MRFRLRLCLLFILLLACPAGGKLSAQIATTPQTPVPAEQAAQDSSTSTDLFVMIGSDFDRPGLLPRANLNIGIGHTYSW